MDSSVPSDTRKRRKIEKAIDSFSITEKIIFWLSTAVFVAASLYLLWQVNQYFLVEVPETGGKLEEGVVGTPRFINPILATSDADKDVTALVYAGLLRATPEGELVDNLSKEHSISEDGLTYTFILRDDIYFHDGEKITAEDVVYTINTIKNPSIRSPRRIAWEDVTVETSGETEVRFKLKQPYAPFIENTTVGIVPKHVWDDTDPEEFPFSQLNIEPVGSGPYYVDSIKRDNRSLPTSYTLKSWRKYPVNRPYIDKFVFKFYDNEQEALEAYRQGEIESLSGVSPKEIGYFDTDRSRVVRATLPRVFGVFFNQNHAPIFINKEVRQALDVALDKEKIISTVLSGYGTVSNGPVPGIGGTASTTEENQAKTERAIEILTKAGWTVNETTGKMEKETASETTPLEFTLSTGGTQELISAAQEIAAQWSLIGADVDVQVFDTSDLNQNVIRPRKYDALFFGEVIGRDLDLYPFWHSSQRNDPGLNISLYTNADVDSIVESLRRITDKTKREELLQDFVETINTDKPGVFVYSPDFIYILPKNVQSVRIGHLQNSSERFLNIHEWFIDTNQVWRIFNN